MNTDTVPRSSGRSLSYTALESAIQPIPGHAKIVSTTSAPLRNPAMSSRADVRGGIREFLSACFQIILKLDTRLSSRQHVNLGIP